MDDRDKIKELMERIEILEYKLSKIFLNEANEIIMTNCPIGDISIGTDCKINFQNCSIGGIMDADIDDAASRIEDLDCRLDDVNDRIDEAEARIDEIKNIES